jgi:hypothetical protein
MVQVTLRVAGFGRPVTRFGIVASCESDADGGTLVILRLRHPLARHELSNLLERPIVNTRYSDWEE